MKILVAMSGGVDSSVSAFLLKNKGYDVMGATFKLFESQGSEKAISDAKKVASFLGIEHQVLDFSREFKSSVVDYFIDEYSNGRTPNPCVVCNKSIKFGLAVDKMIHHGFDKIATGHYVDVFHENNRYIVKRCPHFKDQSYCFCMLSQYQLSKIITPVSKYTKEQIRKIAQDNKIPVWNKSESQDICFIDTSYRDFLHENGVEKCSGNFVDEKGHVLGSHEGIYNYTVGQRRGLNYSAGKRMYIKRINSDSNEIILSEKIEVTNIKLRDVNFVSFDENNFPKEVKVCIRYNSVPIESTIEFCKVKSILNIKLSKSTSIACPGQFAVCYYDNRLVCGGIISHIS